MRAAKRLCAVAVVAVLVLSVPLRVPTGCTSCPPGCPMHAAASRAGDAPAREAARPGCHRAPSPPDGAVCLRSACGGAAVADAGAALRAVLFAWSLSGPLWTGGESAPAPRRLASLDPPAPPTDPPRALRG